jgi:hypothetical protein
MEDIMFHFTNVQKILQTRDAELTNKEALADSAIAEANRATEWARKRVTEAEEESTVACMVAEEKLKEASMVFDERTRFLKAELEEERKKALAERKKAKKAAADMKALNDEYLLLKPSIDKVYKDKVQVMISGLTEAQSEILLKDGRPTSFILSAWLREKWNIPEVDLQVKMFTDGGCYIAPSFNIGTGRKVKGNEIDTKLQSVQKWVFVDIRSFPNVTYVFKSQASIINLLTQNADYKTTGRVPAGGFNKIIAVK